MQGLGGKTQIVLALIVMILNITSDCVAMHAAPDGSLSPAMPSIRTSAPSTGHVETEDVIGTLADGYIAIVNSTFLPVRAVEWNPQSLSKASEVYQDAVMNPDHGYISARKGFGSLSRWAQAMGITPAPEECRTGCKFAGGAIRLVYNPDLLGDEAMWYKTPQGRFPVITIGGARGYTTTREYAYHELAHIWDGAHDWALGAELDQAMEIRREVNGKLIFDEAFKATWNRHGYFASGYSDPVDPRLPHGCEHFAESVLAYFLTGVPDAGSFVKCWADEDPRCDKEFEYDRYDFVRNKIMSLNDSIHARP